jgi:hypothetical protein
MKRKQQSILDIPPHYRLITPFHTHPPQCLPQERHLRLRREVAALESTLSEASGGEAKFDIVNANVKKLKEDAFRKHDQFREGKTKICR